MFGPQNGYTTALSDGRMSWTGDWVHYVYILRCADDKLYTGMSWNVERRVAAHNGIILPPPPERPEDWTRPPPNPDESVRKSKPRSWTSHRRPVTLVFSHEVCCRSCTCKSEKAIKNRSRQEKLELIEDPTQFVPIRCERYSSLNRVKGGGV